MTVGQSIDYDGLTQQAWRTVVRSVLTTVAKSGLPGEHHFFIAFDTRAPGVAMSRRLKEKYPEEMMIVLQHRFWDLSVTDERFEVKLTFDGIPERLVVPYSALKLFFDPSVRFTLQFEEPTPSEDANEPAEAERQGEGEEAGDASRPMRRHTDRRPRKLGGEKSDETAEMPGSAPTPLPLPSRTERSAEPAPPAPAPAPVAAAPEPATAEQEEQVAAAPASATVEPAPSPSGAKVVSIDSWRNRK